MSKYLEKNKPVYYICVLYTLNALIVVVSAWAVNINRFGLDMTISRYIGLRPWTVFMYVIVSGGMSALAFIHINKIKMNIIKKSFYNLAISCVFLCSVFPSNRDWNLLFYNFHKVFSYMLMSCVIITLIWMLIKPVNRLQRIFSVAAILYAVFFVIVFFITKTEYFFRTIFIWENAFIYLFIAELMIEKSREKQ